ncbi:MAG: hypothetical protein JNJ41_09570 [Bacteroidia bacterium]|nr:hypothetical protein [Bacteroidia bacterium]
MKKISFAITLFGLLLFSCNGGKNKETTMMDPNEISPGPILADTLSSVQLKKIDYLYATFKEVDPTTKEKWIEDFKRDQDPDREIEIWEMMANAYNSYCKGKEISLDVKKEVFKLVLMRSGSTEEETLGHLTLDFLKPEEAKEIMKAYTLEAKPIRVIQK